MRFPLAAIRQKKSIYLSLKKTKHLLIAICVKGIKHFILNLNHELIP